MTLRCEHERRSTHGVVIAGPSDFMLELNQQRIE